MRRPAWPWLLIILGVVGLVVALTQAFPGAVATNDDWVNVSYYVVFAALVAAGLVRMAQTRWRDQLRYVGVWTAIVGVLAIGVAFKDELLSVPQRLAETFGGGDPVARASGELVVPRSEGGAFVVIGEVNGQRVRFIVDTGASETVLSPDDARRAGVDTAALTYDRLSETANGVGRSARYVGRIQVGPVAFDNFVMAVNQAPMSTSLLGHSFLNRLESYEVRGDKLILRPRR
jgi:aspartyl protease family protein